MGKASESLSHVHGAISLQETEIFALLQSMERLQLDGRGDWEAGHCSDCVTRTDIEFCLSMVFLFVDDL